MKNPKDQYVTLHGSVLLEFAKTIEANIRVHGWTQADVAQAVQGLFVTCTQAGGCLDDVQHVFDTVMVNNGSPDHEIKH